MGGVIINRQRFIRVAVSFPYTQAAQSDETGFVYYLGPWTPNKTYGTQGLESNETLGGDMEIAGYKRVSTESQNLDRQDFPCTEEFVETISGAKKDRPELERMIKWLRKNDECHIWSIDRLARNLADLQSIISRINQKGATVRFLSENLTFSANDDDPFARLQLQLLGSFAQFERAITLKRQAEGIAKAKERGVYKGRKATIDVEAIKRMKDEGLGATAIAKQLGIGRASVYRVMQAG